MSEIAQRYGRKKPYGVRAIKKQRCAICGEPAVAQWSLCALDNRYIPVCRHHDIEINASLVRQIVHDEAEAAQVLQEYAARVYPEMTS